MHEKNTPKRQQYKQMYEKYTRFIFTNNKVCLYLYTREFRFLPTDRL